MVFDAGAPPGAILQQVRQHAVVLQWLPPRIAIVRLRAGLPPARTVAGTSWYDGAVPASVDLAPTERLFVDAWLSRRETKDRPADGLHWDAPGKEPPDWPDEAAHHP
ncbi:hypothetical protein BCL57_002552 [Agromyces flavus]|uniref:Uncharacterized protein n=1 Tax=Agromyces flavus TaxID=589382 RepID=A0ABT1KNA1_9MICO|nr:hypothetical protein [Agromyces flavus]MCP2368379.1 hypothetical protein [Agromyces flavus]